MIIVKSGSFLLISDIMIKMARKLVKKQKENPLGCAGEGKQSEANRGEVKGTVVYAKF